MWSKTHEWAGAAEWTIETWVGGDTMEKTYKRTLILDCKHCPARKKIVTRVTY